VLRVERPEKDWPLDFVKKSQVLSPSSPFNVGLKGDEGLVSVVYAVSAKPILLPYITVKGCEKIAIVSSLVLRPDGARGIERNGHTFAYVVWGHLVSGLKPTATGIGADISVVFYDVHGAGHFDTVEIGKGEKQIFVPDWVR
jgi:hypothetical protein